MSTLEEAAAVPLSSVPRSFLESQYLASQRHAASLAEELARMIEMQSRTQALWESLRADLATAANVTKQLAGELEAEREMTEALQAELQEVREELALTESARASEADSQTRWMHLAKEAREIIEHANMNCRHLTGGDERRFRDFLDKSAGVPK